MRLPLAVALLVVIAGCSGPPADTRPSFLLVVIDTLRADAVSALGGRAEATPTFDALASEGLLFGRAFADAPWTIPSHATLFTGRSALEHGVGAGRRVVLGPDADTLAERLTEAGYETIALTENPLVSAPFGLDQGFSRHRVRTGEDLVAESLDLEAPGFVLREFSRWLGERDRARPYLAFVNLMDAHLPYEVRGDDAFLPEGTSAGEARAISQDAARICDALPPPSELAVLRSLYDGDVRAADRKLGALIERARGATEGALVTLVTSDHGELFGEERLLDHQFSVHHALLHVPLVVHGLAGTPPARIDTPVSLADVAPSILAWAGLAAPARRLPVRATDVPARNLVAVYGDGKPTDWPADVRVYTGEKRKACAPDDPVFGNQASLLRYPLKLVWHEHHASRLYDVSWDPGQRSDMAELQPEARAELERELRTRLEASRTFEARDDDPPVSPEARERLRSLGYTE